MRTSEVLRGILQKNPGVTQFSVARILASIGRERFEQSLMMFSLPAIVPVPTPAGFVAPPAGVIAYQMVAGRKRIQLPRALLRMRVSRKSLAVAIHAILPALEAVEKLMKPRWSWMSHRWTRRAIGVLVFLLAVAIASPLSGLSVLHALPIFVVSLGLAEQDGLAVLIGLVAGVLSLALVGASSMSARALRSSMIRALRKLGSKLGRATAAQFAARRGYTRLARLLSFEWSELLLMWDPERPTRSAPRTSPLLLPPPAAA